MVAVGVSPQTEDWKNEGAARSSTMSADRYRIAGNLEEPRMLHRLFCLTFLLPAWATAATGKPATAICFALVSRYNAQCHDNS